MKSFKKFLSMLLVVTLLVSGIQTVVFADDSQTEHSYDYGTLEDGDLVWDVYEVSLINNSPSFPNEILTNYSYTNNDTRNMNVGKFSKEFTFYTEDKAIALRGEIDSGSLKIIDINYCGKFYNRLNLKLPDKIRFHYYNTKSVSYDEGTKTNYVTLSVATIESTLTSISTAFNSSWNTKANCTNLLLNLPKSVTVLEDYAFNNNTKLTELTFTSPMQQLGVGVFKNCNNLTSLDLANFFSRINTIPDECFYKCNSLENIKIPDSVLNIGKYAFYQCDTLDYLYLKNNIQYVGESAFADCSHLRYIYAPTYREQWGKIAGDVGENKVIKYEVSIPSVLTYDSDSAIGDYLFKSQDLVITGEVDIDSDNLSVKVLTANNEEINVPVTQFYRKQGGYSTKSFKFSVKEKGTYSIIAQDILGNKLNTTFKYFSDKDDKTSPKINIVSGSGKYPNYSNLTLSITETGDSDSYIGSVEINGVSQKVQEDSTVFNLSLTEDDTYNIKASDVFGNSVEDTFYIDTIAPEINGINDGDKLSETKTLSFSDSGVGIDSIKVNDSVISSNTFTPVNSGSYTVEVVDKAGNSNKISFVLDTVGPSLDKILSNSSYNKAVTVNCNSIIGLKEIKVFYKSTSNASKTYYINNGDKLKSEGYYEVTVSDLVNRYVKYSFTIDKKAPKYSGVGNNKFYNKEKQIKLYDYTETSVSVNGYTYTNSAGSNTYNLYDEGNYKFKIKDKAGNSTSFNVTIDKTAPTISIADATCFRKAKTIKISDKNLSNVYLNNKKLGKVKSIKITNEGKYKIRTVDKAGNSTTVKVVLDTTKPSINLVKHADGTVTFKAKDKLSGLSKVTLNGHEIGLDYVNNYVIRDNGSYLITAIDKAGNKISKRVRVKVK